MKAALALWLAACAHAPASPRAQVSECVALRGEHDQLWFAREQEMADDRARVAMSPHEINERLHAIETEQTARGCQ